MIDRSKPLAVIVCGGRTYGTLRGVTQRERYIAARESEALTAALDQIMPAIVLHGAAKGADTLAGIWCKRRGMEQRPSPADWQQHGKAAGPRRNGDMILDLLVLKTEGYRIGVVAFPGGAGTADCRRQAESAGIAVWEPCANMKEP